MCKIVISVNKYEDVLNAILLGLDSAALYFPMKGGDSEVHVTRYKIVN